MLDPNRGFNRREYSTGFAPPDPNRGFARGVLAMAGIAILVVVIPLAALYYYFVVVHGIVL